MQTDDDRLGAHLMRLDSPVSRLFRQANRLEHIQGMVRDWAQAPLADSLEVANERNDVVVIHAASAAAHTQLHFRRQELLDLLRLRLDQPGLRLETRVRPRAQK